MKQEHCHVLAEVTIDPLRRKSIKNNNNISDEAIHEN